MLEFLIKKLQLMWIINRICCCAVIAAFGVMLLPSSTWGAIAVFAVAAFCLYTMLVPDWQSGKTSRRPLGVPLMDITFLVVIGLMHTNFNDYDSRYLPLIITAAIAFADDLLFWAYIRFFEK